MSIGIRKQWFLPTGRAWRVAQLCALDGMGGRETVHRSARLRSGGIRNAVGNRAVPARRGPARGYVGGSSGARTSSPSEPSLTLRASSVRERIPSFE